MPGPEVAYFKDIFVWKYFFALTEETQTPNAQLCSDVCAAISA